MPTTTIEISFTEDEDKTRADAILAGLCPSCTDGGRAPATRRIPMCQPSARRSRLRALADLSHRLLDEAAHRIESRRGHPGPSDRLKSRYIIAKMSVNASFEAIIFDWDGTAAIDRWVASLRFAKLFEAVRGTTIQDVRLWTDVPAGEGSTTCPRSS